MQPNLTQVDLRVAERSGSEARHKAPCAGPRHGEVDTASVKCGRDWYR